MLVQGERLDLDNLSSCSNLVPRLIGDERRLKQVLINLIRNAMKFTKQGFIEIIASLKPGEEEEEKYLYVQVRDTGSGIA